MDTKPLEKFCPWARVKLIDAIHARCVLNGLDDAGRAAAGMGSEVVGGRVLSPVERRQRDNLFTRIEAVGYNAFVDEKAYTWFNRFMGIRYMEVHGYLPSGIRVLSDTDGSFGPACLRAAGELDLPGLDRDQAIDLAIAGNRSELFRLILIAQCNQLADALPSVFDHVDDADALVLPDALLNKDENNVLYHLMEDIPEETWNDVEVMGWMYQFYNSELKRAYFDSKRKAAVEDIPPATQLFTPDWIVRYMVDNSLGRLWMLNFPESHLAERAKTVDPAEHLMEYYIAPDEEHEDVIRISGPEDITFCDPACGSGHILVYAFRLLFAMYQERGYREREIPSLILEKNLSGMEIDPRAAQIAELALAMCAREHDRRFFTRGVQADVRVLESVDIDADGLAPESPLRERSGLLEGLAHLSEIGSLLAPGKDDIAALESALAEGASDTIFASHASERVKQALGMCRTLARRFDVVVANPPYMGGSSFNPFMSKWMKKHYPDVKSDLFAAFIVRIMNYANDHGEVGIMSPFVWMFIGSYEKLRNKIIDEKTLTSLIQLEYSGFAGATVPICTFTFHNSHIDDYMGGYIRLSDFVGASVQAPKALEAIQNPDCGYFYRADATTFHDIPGSPIAYWASEAVMDAFIHCKALGSWLTTREGMATADNDRFVRCWWEVSTSRLNPSCRDSENATASGAKWFPYQKGGDFRKWFGNNELVVNWLNDGEEIRGNVDPKTGRIRSHNYNGQYAFREGITWSSLSSGMIHLRYSPPGSLFDSKGAKGFSSNTNKTLYALSLINSSAASSFLSFLAPTLDFKVGDVIEIPDPDADIETTIPIARDCVSLSKKEYDSQETSWEFKHNSLI